MSGRKCTGRRPRRAGRGTPHWPRTPESGRRCIRQRSSRSASLRTRCMCDVRSRCMHECNLCVTQRV
eukprot:scaffold68925_cov51-Phaeocystis_antarctica.AAC.2